MTYQNIPKSSTPESRAITQPVRTSQPGPYYPPVEQIQPVYIPRRRKGPGCFQSGCLGVLAMLLLIVLAVLAYFLAPLPTNFMVLGIDRVEGGSAVGRSDTMILVSVNPLRPAVRMLSIPRDLYVSIPGVGENRINTAHFFAEANLAGSGPQAALDTVQANFGLEVPYYVRVQFEGFMRVVDAMGGVTVNLPGAMGGYTAGDHHLNSEQALAFVRDRQGGDDFFRMAHGQILIRSVISQMLVPDGWSHLPAVMDVSRQSMDTNLPVWLWPRLGLAFLRAGSSGIESRTIGRDMVLPFTTSGGAQVLGPNWELINPLIDEMFR
jgi:polyisoprenyl-teichoic acid--peptidoglycan teichoic acid transferase